MTPVICWFSKYIDVTLIPWDCSSNDYLEVENHLVLTPPPQPNPIEKEIEKPIITQKNSVFWDPHSQEKKLCTNLLR